MPIQRVLTSALPPYRAIGYLAMSWSNPPGWAYGSGCLIDDWHILTCSHNMVDSLTTPAPRGVATQVYFYPGYNQPRPGDPPPGGLPVIVGFFTIAYYNGNDAWDVGVFRLANAVHLGPYFVPVVTGAEIIGDEVHVTGYPGPATGEMWDDVDQVAGVHVPTNTMIYTHDTWPGNSGSPTWTYDALSDTVRQHAIHVSRQDGELRRGLLITQPVLTWIQGALLQPTPGAFTLMGS